MSSWSGTPIWIGEFGPVFTGDQERDDQRYRLLQDQLDIYRRYDAGWSVWAYKDVGGQGLVYADPDSGSERCLTFWPRFRTCTDMPAATDRLTHAALIVPVPPR